MSLADQMMEANDEADRLAGANAHLIEDKILGELVEFAANGRHTADFDLLVGDPTQPEVRILPATPNAPARYPHEPRPANDGRKCCDRCTRTFQRSAKSPHPTRRDGKQHTLWIAAGTAVIEVVVCTDCHASLSADFHPIEWR